MRKMWETLVISFCFAVIAGIVCFVSNMVRKLIRALKKRKTAEPAGTEMVMISTSGSSHSASRQATVIRNPIVTGPRASTSVRTTTFMEPNRSRVTRQATPNRCRNYQYSETFKSAFEPPRCYTDPPSYETVMGSTLRDNTLPPPYSSLQMPSAPPMEDTHPLLESQVPNYVDSSIRGLSSLVRSHPLETQQVSGISKRKSQKKHFEKIASKMFGAIASFFNKKAKRKQDAGSWTPEPIIRTHGDITEDSVSDDVY